MVTSASVASPSGESGQDDVCSGAVGAYVGSLSKSAANSVDDDPLEELSGSPNCRTSPTCNRSIGGGRRRRVGPGVFGKNGCGVLPGGPECGLDPRRLSGLGRWGAAVWSGAQLRSGGELSGDLGIRMSADGSSASGGGE